MMQEGSHVYILHNFRSPRRAQIVSRKKGAWIVRCSAFKGDLLFVRHQHSKDSKKYFNCGNLIYWIEEIPQI